MDLESTRISCPYCGEPINVLIEPLDACQQYFEDCQVCCQPILINITVDNIGENMKIDCFRADETP